MLFRNYDKSKSINAYNVLIQSLYPTEDIKTPFGSAFATIPPKGNTTPHMHHEDETFIIIKGNGEIEINGSTKKITENDVIFVSAFNKHTLKNTDEELDMIFVTVYWPEKEKQFEINKYLILTPPPTPNGDLHLGHISGPFTAADVYKRFLKLNGKEVHHVSGSDDYQSYVQLKAMQRGENPKDTADYFSSKIEQTFMNFDIEVDYFLKTSKNLDHQENTQKLVKTMYDKGLLISKKENILYCNENQKPLYEAFVEGTCPHCLSKTDGNLCESCGRPNNCYDIIGYKSKISSANSLQIVEGQERLFFPLSKYKNELKAYYKSVHMTEHLREFCEGILQEDLPDIPVSFNNDWGIEMPVPEYRNQRIYVWFEMAAHYISSVSKVENDNWLISDKIKKVQFLGFDNSFFYAVLLPAIYLSLNPKNKFVDSYVTNEFLNLENQKFSTSRNHAIWADDFIKLYSSDIARLYLSYKRPENFQSNFLNIEFQKFIEFYDKFIIDYLNEFKNEFQTVGNNLSIDINELSKDEKVIMKTLQKAIVTTQDYFQIEKFSPKKIVGTVFELLEMIDEFNKSQSQSENKLAINYIVIHHISLILYPITPGLSVKINQMLSQNSNFTWLDEVKIFKDYFIDPTINFERIELCQTV